MFETVEASEAAVTRRPPPVGRRAHGRVGPDRDPRPGRRRVWESLAAEEPAGYDTTPAGTGACSAATGPDADHAAGTGGAAGVPVSERGGRAAECAARCASTPGSVLGHAVGVLAAALDALAGADVDDEHPAVAGDALVALHGLAARLHAVVLSTLDSFDRRQGWAADGAVTASSWLAARTGTDHTAAHHLVHCARRLRALPRLAAHLAAGDITPAHAAAVTRAATPHRAQAIADAEGILADLALTNPPRDLRHALRRLADAADPDGSDPTTNSPVVTRCANCGCGRATPAAAS